MSSTDIDVTLVDTVDDAMSFLTWLGERRHILAVDTETGGFDFWRNRLRLVQFGDAGRAWSIPWYQWGGVVIEALRKYLGKPMVMHNAKFDLNFLEHHGGGKIQIDRGQLHDTMLMAHLVDSMGAIGLKPLSARLVDARALGAEILLKEAMTNQKWTWDTVPVDFPPYWVYGGVDTVLTARLYEYMEKKVKELGLEDAYALEREALWVVAGMERRGMRVDMPYIQEKRAMLRGYADQINEWVQGAYGINVGSSVKLGEAFVKDGVELYARTATGKWQMDKEVLLSLLPHPLAVAAMRYRRAVKLEGTWLKAFEAQTDPRTSMLHPSVKTVGTLTGRMSSAFHTFPRGKIIRGAFVPTEEDEGLLSSDFDQIEMRLLGHFAGDATMMAALEGGDFHTETARLVYQDPTIGKDHLERQVAKNAGFAKIYGAGAETFALTAGISLEAAYSFLASYDATYPGVLAFQNEVNRIAKSRAASDGFPWVKAPLGRIHKAERGNEWKLVNYLIQGTAADVLKQALVRLSRGGFDPYMLLPVHDEVVFSAPKALLPEFVPEIKRLMEDRVQWKVPLTVGVDGPLARWGDKYKFTEFETPDDD